MNDDDILSGAEHEALNAANRHEPEKRPQKVLIVDDDRALREMIAGILHLKGIQSLLAESADDAMKLLVADDAIELVITDLRMLPTDGLDFIRNIRKSVWADLPVLVMSGDAGIRDAIDAMHLGIVDFCLLYTSPSPRD